MSAPTTPDKTPEWMLLLEKKKNRPHRLAHEIGAGAPCLACGEKCPGLDLHFWRKVCRNCKCKKEEHDVKDDDGYAQFEILLGAGDKRKKPGAVLKMKVPDVVDKAVTMSKNGVPFDWVPPNVSEDIAAEYMQQLPAAKLPISGSDGALYRRQQLERQMPLHDLDAGQCHNLTAEEIEELQKYLDNLKSNVVGQGRVTKVPSLYTEQRHTYRGPTREYNTSTTLHSSYSDQSLRTLPPLPSAYNAVPRPFQPHSNMTELDDLPPPLPDSLPPDFVNNLKTPSSFVPNKNASSKDALLESYPYSTNVAHSSSVPGQLHPNSTEPYGERRSPNQNASRQDTSLESYPYSTNVAHSSSVPGQLSRTSNIANNDTSFYNASSTVSNNVEHSYALPGQFYPSSTGPYGDGSESEFSSLGNAVCSAAVPGQMIPGFSPTRNQQGGDTSAHCLQDASIMFSQNPYSIANSTGVSGNYSLAGSQNIPGNFKPDFSQSENVHANYVGTPLSDGPRATSQNPHDVANSQNNPGNFTSSDPNFQNVHGRSADALPQYGSTVSSQYPHKYAMSSDLREHLTPGCSTQSQNTTGPGQNNSIEAGGFIATQDRQNYQGIHSNLANAQFLNENWSKNSQMPENVRYEHSLLQYDVAGSADIEGNSMPLSAQIIKQSNIIDNDLASQMELLSAEEHPVGSHLNCKHCSEPLIAGNVAVFADRAGDSTAWHPNCFVCNTCDELLVDLIYFFSKGNVYCGRHFAELLNIPRCYACDELIFVKEYTVAEGKTFHVKHFCCYECDDPLAGKQYVPADDQPTCLDCYQEIFGKRCHTCRKQIPAGQQRIGWKELNWHAVDKCFRCYSCSKSLLGRKFVMKNEQPYCDKECVLASGTH